MIIDRIHENQNLLSL